MTAQTTRQIRLGIIGTGLAVEKLHWPALKRLTDEFTVTAFVNRGDANAERFESYSGVPASRRVDSIDALLAREDVDAVLISLPIPDNLPVSRAALDAGKHVICEKPPGANDAEAHEFVELADQYADRVVLIAENMFYLDTYRVARALLDQDVLGRVHLVTSRQISQLVPREGQFSSTPWRQHPGYVGGPHLDAGVHHTAMLRLLCGDAARVSGEIQDANETHGGPSDLVLSLRFVSGAIGSYVASYPELAIPPEPNETRLYGTDAVMSLGRRDGVAVYRPDGSVETWKVRDEDGGYYNEFRNLYEAMTAQAPVVATVAQSYRNMEIITSGLESARGGTTIEIPGWPTPLSDPAVPLWLPAGATDVFSELGDRIEHEQKMVSDES